MIRRAALARSADRSQFEYPFEPDVRQRVGVPFDDDRLAQRAEFARDEREHPFGLVLDVSAPRSKNMDSAGVDEFDAEAFPRQLDLDLLAEPLEARVRSPAPVAIRLAACSSTSAGRRPR